MYFLTVWKFWSVFSVIGWPVYEIGRIKAASGLDARERSELENFAFSEGLTKGLLSAAFPPLCGLFVYSELKNKD